jgi:pyruvate dehydrogenase (quinone)
MSLTTSDLVVETVAKAGVRRAYGLPGDSLNGLTDALRRNGNLAWEHVRHEEAAAFALRAAFDHDECALVDVVTARQELSLPPTITLEQIKGFTLYATRSVLSGRGDELLDLAKTNVTRRLFS